MYEEPTPLLKQASNKEDDFKHLKQKIIPLILVGVTTLGEPTIKIKEIRIQNRNA
ncbi:hypothetical protein CWI37_1127p0030 [Hamiltosporidium tvaerminnensis]|uniref:Uncharacterized protein n=2 Tax=Hamiltosporidium TaxID=1176354 RepID=A0A4V2JVX8_9MICR|nr:hypothetical protein CWI37_1127p0030 [Hamiltosporidium tvaerminnensis]TBU05772.1 hypothetical protein CWI39_0624p0010 [Hamiltosporidium magnivora]